MKIVFLIISVSFLSFCASNDREEKDQLSSRFITPDYKSKELESLEDFGPTNKKTKYFAEVSQKIGLDDQEAVNLYAVDWSGDGVTDLVVLPDFYSRPVFYEYSTKLKKFIKKEGLFTEYPRVSFLAFADFNKDNLLDMVAVTLNQESEVFKHPLRLFLGSKKSSSVVFSEVSQAFPNDIEPTTSISLFDYDLDGWLDVYLGNWYSIEGEKRVPAPDNLFHGVAGGIKFQRANGHLEGEYGYSDELNVYTSAKPTYGVSSCDIDQNGYPDILAASSGGFNNKLWLNLSDKDGVNRIFKDFGDSSGFSQDGESGGGLRSGGNTFYGLCQDYNDDGIFDIAVGELVNAFDPESRDRSSILTGSTPLGTPKFIRTEYHKDDGSGRWSQGDRRALWSDLDHDSHIDLVIANSGFPKASRLIYFKQDKDHSFADEAKKYGIDMVNPSGVVQVDFNRDGQVDLLTGQTNLRDSRIKSKIYAFQSLIKSNHQSIWIRLIGKKSNAHGIGSKVKLITSGRTYLRNVEYLAGGLPSQNEMNQMFTLDLGEEPKRLEIEWPYIDKNKQILRTTIDISTLKFDKDIWLDVFDKGSYNVIKKN